MIYTYSSAFTKEYGRLDKGLKLKLAERLKFFEADEFDPILNSHKLKHDFAGYRSINVTGDWRLIYSKIEVGVTKLYRIGTHHQLFGK